VDRRSFAAPGTSDACESRSELPLAPIGDRRK
jgi:hypothetical protein